MIRCTVGGQLGADENTPKQRWKVLTAVLDNSYSMCYQWSLVADAISRVYTDELLRDSKVVLSALTYNTDAAEVHLPESASALKALLLRDYKPTGITNFKKAFELAQKLISEKVGRLQRDGVPPSMIDITTLLLTDGEDTSAPPLGCRSAAATAKARAAGDAFRSFLSDLGCPSYTCIAAFGENHNPEQCQYLGDRYYYINREEVLADWLTGSMDDLLRSSQFCSLKVELPPGLSLAEPLPNRIGLGTEGSIDHDIWVNDVGAGGEETSPEACISVSVLDSLGVVSMQGSALLSSAKIIQMNGAQGHLFLLDTGELQLRQIALELRGHKPTPTEMALLRERLAGVKALVDPVQAATADVKSALSGRLLLSARVEELETRRMRLSYGLAHFDEEDQDTRNIGSVGIDAILRDASQCVPLGAKATKYAQRMEAAAALPPAEELSLFGRQFADAFSGCNAKQLSDQGTALFFCLNAVEFSSDGTLDCASPVGSALVEHDIFALLSKSSTKEVQVSTKLPTSNQAESITHLGLPLYATLGHFLRAQLFLTEVLGRLSPGGVYVPGKSEYVSVRLLGHALASNLRTPRATAEKSIAFLHQARSVSAILKNAPVPSPSGEGGSLLAKVLKQAESFLVDVESQKQEQNLYCVVAIGIIAAVDACWPRQKMALLGEAIVIEAVRRKVERAAKNLSDSERMRLAWVVLGPCDAQAKWLDVPLEEGKHIPEQQADFDVLTAANDLEALEAKQPGEYSPREKGLVARLLSAPCPPAFGGTPPFAVLGALHTLLTRWGAAADAHRDSGGLWKLLDELMTNDEGSSEALLCLENVLQRAERIAAMTLRDVLVDPAAILDVVARTYCGDLLPKRQERQGAESSLRCDLASVIRTTVQKRADAAREHPIVGCAFPCARRPSPERMHRMWGAAATPRDRSLYNEVRSVVHRRHALEFLAVKDALTEKEYRRRGGIFAFPTPLDTFIPGLHQRTRDLHRDWARTRTMTEGLREEAIDEMLLRLCWDDRDKRARRTLKKIIGQIWDGLENLPTGEPIPSALWVDGGSASEACAGKGGDSEDWDML